MRDNISNVSYQSELIFGYFTRLGFGKDLTSIYLALHMHGPQTVSELARHSGVERTRIYRLADELASSGLVEIETRYRRSIYKAAPINNVHILLAKKEQELRELQADFTKVADVFAHNNQNQGTRVQFYSGKEGTKQLFWNETKASTNDQLCILRENMQIKTNHSFFERWVRRCNERGLRFRGLIGDEFLRSQKQWYGKHQNERIDHWESRYLPESVLKIAHSMIIYDNVTTFYNWQSEEIFGLEIYNQEIADTHRQYFEMLWERATPIDNTVSQQRNT